ncbi:YojF family protein [Cytobacillus kochii]|uniref:YojF family protein n=1 Tax=Cytobacillus kochii TaxID=859143 RepID=UPI003CCC3470
MNLDIVMKEQVQLALDERANKDIYIHLETTNGAYASHFDETFFSSGAYIRNAKLKYIHSKIAGNGPYRIGLKTDIGWVYAEGITHYEIDEHDRLLMAGHDFKGKLAVSLEISETPFE